MEETLSLMLEKSEQVFISSLRQQIDGLLVRVEAPPRDLSPTSAISHLLAVLRDMLSTASMSEGLKFLLKQLTEEFIFFLN